MAEVAEYHALDLLHVHYAIPHSISAYLAQKIITRRKLPFVTTLHGTDITLVGSDRSYFPITRFSIEQSDGVTSISQYLERQTIDTFGVDKSIRVIHNFVNCDLYRPSPESRPKRRRLLHLSNFRPVKRPLDCIHILQRVLREVDVSLSMVGDGPERGPAESLARRLGISDRVSFLGKQDHVERLIPANHVFLLPSELEGFGLAALEAMACGVPAVATAAGGVPELITHGVDGFLEAPGDVEAQAARVIQLLTDEPLYTRMSEAARHTAETRFCTTKIISRYEAFYEELVAQETAH
jgi:N-acetyl-alpha-D-glucosaminyl L-malate synthase BshA